MIKNLLFPLLIVLVFTLVWDYAYTSRHRIISVMDLPQREAFYSETADSYYDLAYIFSQKRFLGMVVSSNYRNGSYALIYQDKNLLPYQLSSEELLHFLAVNNLPTPSKLPRYPIYENPLLFYLVVAMILFFLGKRKVIRLSFFCLPLKKSSVKKRNHQPPKKTIYAGYLRRRY